MQSEKLTSRTPLLLTITVILLVVLRIAVWSVETSKTQEPDGIKWQEPSKADLAGISDYQPKLVFYYFCEENSEPCRRVNHGALLNKNVVKLVNDSFLPIRVLSQPGTELSKELQQRFGVSMCPAFVIALPNGNEIGMQEGYFGMSARNLLSFIKYCKQRKEYVAGLDYLSHDQYEQAAQALQTWFQTKDRFDSQALDGALFCALAHMMLFRENAAQQVLAKIRNSQYENDSNWPQPLVQFLLGKLSATDLLRMCDHQDNRQSQSLYFTGMIELRNGNLQGAVNNFRQVDKINEVSPEIRSLINGQLSITGNPKN